MPAVVLPFDELVLAWPLDCALPSAKSNTNLHAECTVHHDIDGSRAPLPREGLDLVRHYLQHASAAYHCRPLLTRCVQKPRSSDVRFLDGVSLSQRDFMHRETQTDDSKKCKWLTSKVADSCGIWRQEGSSQTGTNTSNRAPDQARVMESLGHRSNKDRQHKHIVV